MDSYLSEVEAYSQCLGDWVQKTAEEAQLLSDQAVETYQRHIDYWNCKARDPEAYCAVP